MSTPSVSGSGVRACTARYSKAHAARMNVGLAYNDVTMAIEAEEPGGLNGQLNWDYNGWLVYVQANFGRGD